MRPLSELLAAIAANENKKAKKLAAFSRLTHEQRIAAMDHILAIHPGKPIFHAEEILEAHMSLIMGA